MTSSPGSSRVANVSYTACLPPLVTSTWFGLDVVAGVPGGLVRDRLAQLGQARPPGCTCGTAARRRPAERPRRCSPGVGKSGSPAPKPMTGRPAAFSALALASTASVADSEIAEMRAETLVGMGLSLFRRGDTPAGLIRPGTLQPGGRPPEPPRHRGLPGPPYPRAPTRGHLRRRARTRSQGCPPDTMGPVQGLCGARVRFVHAPNRQFDGKAVQTYTSWTDRGAVVAAACPGVAAAHG